MIASVLRLFLTCVWSGSLHSSVPRKVNKCQCISLWDFCGLDQWISSMLNLITGSAERRSPRACDHLSGSFSLSPSGSGLLSPSPQSECRASAECRESCGSSRPEEEPIGKTCAQEATRDVSPIIFVRGIQRVQGNVSKSLMSSF